MFQKNNPYYRQVRLLMNVLPIAANASDFALKGGTAINLFVRDMPRLSVDIDLTYLPVKTRDESLSAISTAFKQMAYDIEKQLKGTRVLRLQQRQDGELTKLQVQKDGMNIKIETSPVLRGSVREPLIRSVAPAVEELFGFVEAPVVHLDDLYAGKICAALDRQHPRDFFDIMCLMDNEGVSDELLDVFVVYLVSSNQSMAKLLQPNLIDLKQIFEQQFIGMTRQPVTLSKLEKTREDLVSLIHRRLSDSHRQFLMGFKKGAPDWTLLDLSGIADLPSVKWKMHNLDLMSANARTAAINKLHDILYGHGHV